MFWKKRKVVDTHKRAYDLVAGDRILVFGVMMMIDRIEFDPKPDEKDMHIILHLVNFYNPVSKPGAQLRVPTTLFVETYPNR